MVMKKLKKNTTQPPKLEVNQKDFDHMISADGASYTVKYLGYIEVSESRGVKVCSNAVNRLLKEKKHKKKMTLKISIHGVRLVDDVSRVLILDQPIEKISFCAPDTINRKLFSYIARDGASKRWLCYGFYAVNDPGEKLSHALGCAFSACLQKKQSAAANKTSNNSTAAISSKESSVKKQFGSTSTAPVKPFTKSNSAGVKRLPPKEIVVPLPENIVNRDRSATTIGISTPPTSSTLPQRGERGGTQESSDEGDVPEAFTANLADIILFDPNDTGEEEVEQRKRAQTEHPAGLLKDLSEFDPLNPQFKTMQFEDNFVVTNEFYSTLPSNTHFSSTNPFCNLAASSSQAAPSALPADTASVDDFDMFANSRMTKS